MKGAVSAQKGLSGVKDLETRELLKGTKVNNFLLDGVYYLN